MVVARHDLDEILASGRKPLELECDVRRRSGHVPPPEGVDDVVVDAEAPAIAAGLRRSCLERRIRRIGARRERHPAGRVAALRDREDLRAVAAYRGAVSCHRRDLPADRVRLGIHQELYALRRGDHAIAGLHHHRARVPAVGEIRKRERRRRARLRRKHRRLGGRVELGENGVGRRGDTVRVRAFRHAGNRDRRRRAANLRGNVAKCGKRHRRGAGRSHGGGDRRRHDLAVALGRKVQEHVGIVAVLLEVHLALEGSVGVEELAADVDEDHTLSVRVCLDDFVRRLVVGILRHAGRVMLRVRVAVGEDRHQEDLRLGMLRENEIQNSLHARGDVRGIVLRRLALDGVVRADQEVEELRRVAVEASALETPQEVLGEIARAPEVEHLRAQSVHGIRIARGPLLRDGVAEKDDIVALAADCGQVEQVLLPEEVLHHRLGRRIGCRHHIRGTRRRHEVGGHRGAARSGVDVGRDRLRPDFVTGRVKGGVIGVEERGLKRVVVRLEEKVRHVDPRAAVRLGVAADFVVDEVVARTHGVGLVEPARQNRLDDDLGGAVVGREVVDYVADRADGLAWPLLGLCVDRGIVAADHEEDRLGASDLAVLNAPEDVLGAVAVEAEVEHRLVAGEVRRKRGRACRLPVLRKFVTDEDDVLLYGTVRERRDLLGMACRPPVVDARDRRVRAESRKDIRRDKCEARSNEEFKCFCHGRNLSLIFCLYCTYSIVQAQLPSWV